MAYKQNSPFSRRANSPLNDEGHGAPLGHEHRSGEEWKTIGTQEGIRGDDIITAGRREYTVPGSDQAGTEYGYEESYGNLTDEQKAQFPTLADWETYVRDYNRENQSQTFEETRERDVNINRVKPRPPITTPKTYDFKITNPDDRYGPPLDVNWEWTEIANWAKKKYGGNWKNSPHIKSWMQQNNLYWPSRSKGGRQGRNTQNITDYTYNTKEIN